MTQTQTAAVNSFKVIRTLPLTASDFETINLWLSKCHKQLQVKHTHVLKVGLHFQLADHKGQISSQVHHQDLRRVIFIHREYQLCLKSAHQVDKEETKGAYHVENNS